MSPQFPTLAGGVTVVPLGFAKVIGNRSETVDVPLTVNDPTFA